MPDAPALQLVLGSRAREIVLERGLRLDLFDTVVGASGGPKWLVLAGLDRWLFPRLARQARPGLRTIGSSIGAWRMACLAQPDPAAAIARLEHHYIEQSYEPDPDPATVSREARRILAQVLPGDAAQAIVDHRRIHTHVVVARGRRLLAGTAQRRVAVGSALTASLNLVSRGLLPLMLERVCFHAGAPGSALHFRRLPVTHRPLRADKVHDVIVASGTIPLVMEGVRSIEPGATYWDGGMTDYHFDPLPEDGDGLVLYPHFYPHLVPGWFDKPLPWRRVDPRRWDRLVLISPSREFVAALPHGRIPDRKDFHRFDTATRQRRWRQAVAASERLAEEFAALEDPQRLRCRLGA